MGKCADMRNREFNERRCQKNTRLRRYDNHQNRIPTLPVQQIREDHTGKDPQLASDDEFIDYLIEIKNYNHVYREWNFPYNLCSQEDHQKQNQQCIA